ncbi:MAG: hypothetical protein HQ556_09060 [Candidatus Marinimicrobia bacterium]|nr:hypothetical protein [Candidatus Neomarinimicrobiota bacterium]
MMQNKVPETLMKTLLFLAMASLLLGQSAWNTGDLSFTYQSFPTPAQTLDLSGDLISDEVPHEGVGGFELALGDTNLVTLVAYDLYVNESDTLADIFVIFMSDTLALEEGEYAVNPSPDALKMFVWLSEVDPESLAGLLDASFTLDSLAAFNPYISVSGDFEILAISPFHFEMNFTGVMVNTSLQLLTISDGSFNLWNTLPVSAYTQGSVDYTTGSESGTIDGALNPLTDSEGAGAVLTQTGDTLTYNFISYQQLPQNFFNVYGMILIGEESHFPLDGSESLFNISLTDNALPRAVPYMLLDVSLDEILLLLESGDIPDPDEFSQLYLPIGLGSATFAYTSEGNAQLEMDNVPMSNSIGDVTSLSTDWLLTNSLTTSIRDETAFHPMQTNLLGDAYPNPFNSSTMIPIQLTAGDIIGARLYNLRGQEVHKMEFGFLGPGQQQLFIDLGGSNLGGGLYYYALFSQQDQLGSGSFVYLK